MSENIELMFVRRKLVLFSISIISPNRLSMAREWFWALPRTHNHSLGFNKKSSLPFGSYLNSLDNIQVEMY
jgi:hypothetical protein